MNGEFGVGGRTERLSLSVEQRNKLEGLISAPKFEVLYSKSEESSNSKQEFLWMRWGRLYQ